MLGVLAQSGSAIKLTVKMFRRKGPDPLAIRRLYQAATGADRDRAREDLEFVSDRLMPFLGRDSSGDLTQTIRGAAQSLVEAAANSKRRLPEAVSDTFARYIEATEADSPATERAMEAADAYVTAWQTHLALSPSPGRRTGGSNLE